MKTALRVKLVLGLTVVVVLAQARPAQAAALDDTEDSPLYAASRKNAFTEMLARDQTPTSQPGPGAAGEIIAVEGTQWHILSGPPAVGRPGPRGGTTKGPLPRDITVGEATCISGYTCQTATCYPNATCIGSPTCYSTCSTTCTTTCGYTCARTCMTTCGVNPTCTYTCYSTCYVSPTCLGWPSCSGPTCSATCDGNSTCIDTCTVAVCLPPTITAVNVPQPGQFQFSFYARGQQVSYNVLYCTNLDAAQWTAVFSLPANNTTVTFTHTNNAPRAYYRVSIQNL